MLRRQHLFLWFSFSLLTGQSGSLTWQAHMRAALPPSFQPSSPLAAVLLRLVLHFFLFPALRPPTYSSGVQLPFLLLRCGEILNERLIHRVARNQFQLADRV